MNKQMLTALLATTFLLSQLTACTISPRNKTVFHLPDGKEVTCFEPPPDVMLKAVEGKADLAAKEIGEILKAGGSVKLDVQKLRELSPGINDYEVLEFRLCTQYGNGSLTPEQYQKFQAEILPIIRPSSKPSIKSETEIRFDAQLVQANFFRSPLKGNIRAELRWLLKPVVADNVQATHIFAGMAVVHDDELIDSTTDASKGKDCPDTPSCKAKRVWSDLNESPIILRGGSEGTFVTWTPELPGTLKMVRVYWEFYQRETDGGNLCQIDSDRPNPSGGVPFLKVVTPQGKEVQGSCYKSYDKRVYNISS